MKEKLRFLIISFSLIILTSSLFFFLTTSAHSEFEKNVTLSVNKMTQETLTFSELNLKPGDTVEYTINVKCRVDGKFEVSFDFIEEENGNLAEFVEVEIECDGVKKTENLKTLFLTGKLLRFDCTLSGRETKKIIIRYTMPSEVDNDAKNTWSKFNVVFTAIHK